MLTYYLFGHLGVCVREEAVGEGGQDGSKVGLATFVCGWCGWVGRWGRVGWHGRCSWSAGRRMRARAPHGAGGEQLCRGGGGGMALKLSLFWELERHLKR